MISCQLYGRIGNQLFILATTIATALRNKKVYSIPNNITCPPGLVTDPIYFRHFTEVQDFVNDPENFSNCKLWKEPADQSFLEINVEQGVDLLLYGYFQSEKYFVDQRKGVLNALSPAFTMRSSNFDQGGYYVSIHVRRGDYLEKPECHPILSIHYYALAIQFFNKKGFYKFVVFSDDLPWCREQLNSKIFPDSRFIYSSNQSALEDLQSMKACRHNIIANSSFSWWGAWLNEDPNKIVIAPEQWYGPALSHINTKDLLPENWIKL